MELNLLDERLGHVEQDLVDVETRLEVFEYNQARWEEFIRGVEGDVLFSMKSFRS